MLDQGLEHVEIGVLGWRVLSKLRAFCQSGCSHNTNQRWSSSYPITSQNVLYFFLQSFGVQQFCCALLVDTW